MKKHVLILIYFLYSSLTIGQTTEQIVDYFDRLNKLERFSGVALIQQGDSILFHDAFGFSNASLDQSNNLETTFDIGSVSKQFTAAAILKLSDESRINLSDPINKYLPELGSKHWDKVTIHHLLSHQSGIPSVMQSGQGLDDFWPEERAIALKEVVAYFQDLKLKSKPGKKYRYNNSGYILLAAIIENVTGQSYESYMRDSIFIPNGLKRTQVGSEGMNNASMNQYNYTKELTILAPQYHHSWYTGAGAIYSTANDLSNWYDILHNSDFLSAEAKKLMFSRQAENYGYGWVIENEEDEKIVYHDGTNFGSTSFFITIPNRDLRIILLTNQTYSELEMLGDSESFIRHLGFSILDILNNQEIELPPPLSESLNAENFSHLSGIYDFGEYKIEVNGGIGGIRIDGDSSQYSLLRYAAHQSIEPELDSFAPTALNASHRLSHKRFWKFAKYCDGEMKFVSRSGILRVGYKMITKNCGDIHQDIVYKIDEYEATARFYGELGNIDIIFVRNGENKIQGVFDTKFTQTRLFESLKPKPINEHEFLLDGFPLGESDSILRFYQSNDGQLILEMTQNGRVFKALKIT